MIIGLCGPEGAGKSTAARMMAAQLSLPIKPFAGPLKAMLEAVGVEHRNLYGSQADKEEPLEILGGKSARFALQSLGTDWGRDMICPNLWAHLWLASVNPTLGCIADDVRFTTESDAIRSLGGFIVCVVRSKSDFDRPPTHASTNFGAIRSDVTIFNSGSMSDLEIDVAWALSGLKRFHARASAPAASETAVDAFRSLAAAE